MTVLVPKFRRTPSVRGIKATLPVGAATWGDMARLHNWTKGQPRCLIPGIYQADDVTFTTADDLTMAVRFYPSGYHHTRLWSIRGSGTNSVGVTIGSLDRVDLINSSSGLFSEALVREELSSLPTAMTAVDTDIRFQIDGQSGSLDLMDLRCWEVPHPYLTDAEGQATTRIVSGQPITADVVSVLRSGAADMQIGHRMLGAWAVPYGTGATPTTTTAYAKSSTSGTFANAWSAAIPALARNTTQAGGTSAERVYADVFAWTSGGNAEIRLKGTGGAGNTGTATTISNTTPAWTTLQPLEVELEDLSETTGMPSGTFETVDVQFRVTGATTIYIASAILYEPTS